MDPASQPIGVKARRNFRWSHGAKGFTLTEVMMAALVFVMAAAGLYTILLKSYQVAALARYHDDARAVLRTFADQFERLQTADPITNYRRELFVTSNETGKGLRYWDATMAVTPPAPVNGLSDQAANDPLVAAQGSYLLVTLGGNSNPIVAKVTRTVLAINPGPGAVGSVQPGGTFPAGTDPIYAASGLWEGTFTITYPVDPSNGNPLNSRTMPVQVQSVSVLRTP